MKMTVIQFNYLVAILLLILFVMANNLLNSLGDDTDSYTTGTYVILALFGLVGGIFHFLRAGYLLLT